MKKLLTLFSFLAFFSIIFIGCQSTEDIIGPEGLDKGGPPVNTTFNWDRTIGTSTVVDLVAGQTHEVGTVTVEKDGACGLKVTYSLNVAGKINEVHVDLTLDPANFTVNSQNKPVFGNFDSKTYGASISGIGGSEVTVTFDCDQLIAALGTEFDPNATVPTKIYIAAHSGVCVETGTFGVSEEICPDLPESNTLNSYIHPGGYPPVGPYFKLTFANPMLDNQTTFEGWCADPVRNIYNTNLPEDFNFVCSYNLGDLTCLVDKPGNLDLANWIINNRLNYGDYQVQAAMWHLLSNSTDWYTFDGGVWYNSGFMTLVNDAIANGEGFKPTQCDQKVLILAYNQDGNASNPCDNITLQILAFEVPVKCEPVYRCDTAMGFNFPLDDKSAPFNHQWFRYFAFSYL